MRKHRFVSALLMPFFALSGLISCGGQQSSPSEKELIKSIVAKEETVNMRIGDSSLLSNFYTINSDTTLSVAQKRCTYTSSNESSVRIVGKSAEAVSTGSSVITVVSEIDTTKKCTFTITVSGVFIDREMSMIPTEDDFSHELEGDTNTGWFRTSSMLESNYYYVAGINDKSWYVETDMTINAVKEEERWPKVGMVARGFDARGTETMVAFFLNADIGRNDEKDEHGVVIHEGVDNNYWQNFGVCEVSKGGHWAWEEGMTTAFARHNDEAWSCVPKIVTFGTKVNLGVARDGADFHIYIDHTYKGSFKLSTDLEILYENGEFLNSNVGFFHFNSDVTFANYLATNKAEDVNAKIPASPVYLDVFK